MKDKKTSGSPDNLQNAYGDGDIPPVDLPHGDRATTDNVERLPESTRPRKDGPGGD